MAISAENADRLTIMLTRNQDVERYDQRCERLRARVWIVFFSTIVCSCMAPIWAALLANGIFSYFLYQDIQRLDPANALSQTAQRGYVIEPQKNPKVSIWGLLTFQNYGLKPTPLEDRFALQF